MLAFQTGKLVVTCVSESGKMSSALVTFAVPGVNKMIVLVVCTHKMSMENNVAFT